MISTVLLPLLTLACMCSSQDLSQTLLTTSQWSVRTTVNSSNHCLLASGNFTLVLPQINEDNTSMVQVNRTWVVPENATAKVSKRVDRVSLSCNLIFTGSLWWTLEWVKSALAGWSHWEGELDEPGDLQGGQVSCPDWHFHEAAYWCKQGRNRDVWPNWLEGFQYPGVANKVCFLHLKSYQLFIPGF